jgi:hypothetical protein
VTAMDTGLRERIRERMAATRQATEQAGPAPVSIDQIRERMAATRGGPVEATEPASPPVRPSDAMPDAPPVDPALADRIRMAAPTQPRPDFAGIDRRMDRLANPQDYQDPLGLAKLGEKASIVPLSVAQGGTDLGTAAGALGSRLGEVYRSVGREIQAGPGPFEDSLGFLDRRVINPARRQVVGPVLETVGQGLAKTFGGLESSSAAGGRAIAGALPEEASQAWSPEWFVSNFGRMAPQLAAGVGIAATGKTAAALLPAFVTEGGLQAHQVNERLMQIAPDMPEGERAATALIAGGVTGAINAGLERVQILQALNRFAPMGSLGPGARKFITDLVVGGTTEAAQGTVQEGVASTATGEPIPPGFIGRRLQEGALGAMVEGVVGSASPDMAQDTDPPPRVVQRPAPQPQPPQAQVDENAGEAPPASPQTQVAAPVSSPVKTATIPVDSLRVDPARFQYKIGTDARGVTGELAGVGKFDPEMAGVVAVWQDPADGQTYVVNGHHRFELARRTGQPAVNVLYLSAPDAKAARMTGAMINIAEGRGTSVDAAKLFRDTGIDAGALADRGVSMSSSKAEQGLALARLNDGLWQQVYRGDLSPERGAAIGRSLPDHADQEALWGLLERQERSGHRLTNDQIQELVRLVRSSNSGTETQGSLFGETEVRRNYAVERARLSDYVRRRLSRDKRLFSLVAKEVNAEDLARAGNIINVDESKKIAGSADMAAWIYDRASTSVGPVSAALNEAAEQLAKGVPYGEVSAGLYGRIGGLLEQEARALGQGGREAQGQAEDQPPAEGRDPGRTGQGAEGAGGGAAQVEQAPRPEPARAETGSASQLRPPERDLLGNPITTPATGKQQDLPLPLPSRLDEEVSGRESAADGDTETGQLFSDSPSALPPAMAKGRGRGGKGGRPPAPPKPPPTPPPSGRITGPSPTTPATIVQDKHNRPESVAEQVKRIRAGIKDGSALKVAQNVRDMMTDLSAALNLGTPGIGRARSFSRRTALGFYRFLHRDIRNIGADSYRTHAHEIGHALHELLFPDVPGRLRRNRGRGIHLVFPKSWRRDLEALGKALYGKRKPRIGGYTSEGWAEVVRYLLIKPSVLKKYAPTVYREAVRTLVTEQPEVWNALTRFRLQKVLLETGQDPIGSYLVESRRKRPKILTDLIDGLRGAWFDRFARVTTFKHDLDLEGLPTDQDPHVGMLRTAGRIEGDFKHILFSGPWDVSDATHEPIGKPLVEILRPVRDRLDEWRRYMIALRAKEKRAQGFGYTLGTLPDAAIDAVIAAGDADPDLHQAAGEFQELNEWIVREYAVANDLVSPEVAQKIIDKNLHYITFRHMRTDSALDPGRGGGSGFRKGFTDQKAGLGRFREGKGELLLDPLESFLTNVQGIVVRAQRNRTARRFTNLWDKNHEGLGRWLSKVDRPMEAFQPKTDDFKEAIIKALGPAIGNLSATDQADMMVAIDNTTAPTFFEPGWMVDKKTMTIRVLKGGKPEFYEVKDRQLLDVLDGLTGADVADPWMALITGPAKLLRMGATSHNPSFFVPNFVRDTFQALTMTESSYRDLPAQTGRRLRGLAGAFKSGEVRRMFEAGGASMEAVFPELVDPKTRRIDLYQLFGPPSLRGPGGVKPKLLGLGRTALEEVGKLGAIQRINEHFERMTRYAEFEAVRRGRTDRASIERAAQAAADITIDFQRGGRVAKNINRVVPFFNATLQGSSKMARYAREHPVQALVRTSAFLVLPSLLSMMLNRDNEDYWAKPLRLRDRWWFFPIGRDEAGAMHYIRIPKPYGLGLISMAMERSVSRAMGIDPISGKRGDPQAFRGMPMAAASEMLPPTIPATVGPIVSVLSGELGWDHFFQRPIVPRRDEGLPAEFQGADFASDTARWLGQTLQYPPGKVDYLIRAYTGGLGKDLTRTGLDPIVRQLTGEDARRGEPRGVEDWMVLRSFLGGPTKSDHEAIRRFYDDFNDAFGVHRALSRMEGKEAEAYAKAHAGDLQEYSRLKLAHQELGKVWSSKRDLLADRKMDPLELEKQLRQLDAVAVQIVRGAYGSARPLKQEAADSKDDDAAGDKP